ncbi:uncharacterized protein LOC106478611 isoform X2 [Limulus polyphemus]|uniref:Uncharacterized protein LOC106478611 isoform X2 n=1 Tax=Limulus polyphemus TaxID=6850 RepID=A0ABM1S2T5_LIMPO|nr:uncharacterized protein LOC106478611 isoform X2 [Limulus polyphemus]
MWITSSSLRPSTPTTARRKYHVYGALLLVMAVLRTVYPAVPMYQAVVGQSAQIPCNISLPSEVDSISLVLWYKSGISAPIFSVDSRKGPLEKSKHFTSDFLGQRGYFDISIQPSVLTINPIQKDDEGDYRCRIDFRYGRTFNSIVTLNVIVPPKEVIIVDETNEPIYGYIGPYNEGSKLVLGCIAKADKPKVSVTLGHGQVMQRIQTGDDVYLHCQYSSNPEVTRIEWQFQRGTLISNSRVGVFVRNQSLVLENVRMEQSGTYRCLADNEEGRGESEGLELNIKYVPVCKKGQKIAYAVTVNELVKVSCEVDADPDDVTFTWSVNNTGISRELLSFDSSGLRSVARYIPRNKKDFGFLACKARNIVGEQIEPCIFTLIAVGPPSPPSNCNISNSTNSTIFVECSHGDDGGLQQRFHVEVYILPNKQLVANLTKSNAPAFILSSLPSGARLLLLVYSSNGKGRSGTVTLTSYTLEPVKTESSIRKSPRLRPLLGILLGVVAALGLMALFIVIFFRRRRTRKQNTADEGYDQDEKFNSMTQDFTISKAVTSSEPDLITIQNNSPISTFLPVQKRTNKGGTSRHMDRLFFKPKTVTQTESLQFNPDDQYEFCQPQTSFQEAKGWTSSSLGHCQDERSGLSYIGDAGWKDLENDVQAKHELLTVSNPSHRCLQVYPVREYRRYTPV